jgi:UDP-2,3-diacylglucosamine pyrophosphatase LpxH
LKKRKVDVVVISDVHLGTFGCHAKELTEYLSTIKPKILILNGDIIDIWQFRKSYFPVNHLKVIKKIISLSTKAQKCIISQEITMNFYENLQICI